MDSITLSLGSNLGDRLKHLEYAKQLLKEHDIRITKESRVVETEPWGHSGQPWFLNQVVIVETVKSPEKLLETCLTIEAKIGRIRKEKNDLSAVAEPRIIDIDLLTYRDERRKSASLTLPHPEMSKRRFVLVPLAELIPEAQTMLDECKDSLIVKPYSRC